MKYGWLQLVLVDKNGRPLGELKPKQEWNKWTIKEISPMPKLFIVLSTMLVLIDGFCIIAIYKYAKEAWDIFVVIYKGNFIVKLSKL